MGAWTGLDERSKTMGEGSLLIEFKTTLVKSSKTYPSFNHRYQTRHYLGCECAENPHTHTPNPDFLKAVGENFNELPKTGGCIIIWT
jgi:hypothetical protein